jgi:hypothetical protein
MMNGAGLPFSDDPPRGRKVFLAGCGILAMVLAEPVAADEGKDGGDARAFSIPAQALADALGRYGEQTHIQMFVDGDLTAGHRSSAVIGKFTTSEALRGLLAGTGLAVRSLGDAGFTLEPMPDGRAAAGRAMEASVSAGASPSVRFSEYSAVIQQVVHEALCRDRATMPGSFRALVRLWIGETGRVGRSEILSSTGDSRRDAALEEALRDLVIDEAPPPGLPQPVTLLFQPAIASAENYCAFSAFELGPDEKSGPNSWHRQ